MGGERPLALRTRCPPRPYAARCPACLPPVQTCPAASPRPRGPIRHSPSRELSSSCASPARVFPARSPLPAAGVVGGPGVTESRRRGCASHGSSLAAPRVREGGGERRARQGRRGAGREGGAAGEAGRRGDRSPVRGRGAAAEAAAGLLAAPCGSRSPGTPTLSIATLLTFGADVTRSPFTITLRERGSAPPRPLGRRTPGDWRKLLREWRSPGLGPGRARASPAGSGKGRASCRGGRLSPGFVRAARPEEPCLPRPDDCLAPPICGPALKVRGCGASGVRVSCEGQCGTWGGRQSHGHFIKGRSRLGT